MALYLYPIFRHWPQITYTNWPEHQSMASSRLVAPQGWCIPQAGGDFEHGEKQFRLCHIPMIQNCNLECGKSLETGNHIPIKTKSLEIGNPLSDDSPKTKINQPRRLRLSHFASKSQQAGQTGDDFDASQNWFRRRKPCFSAKIFDSTNPLNPVICCLNHLKSVKSPFPLLNP